MAAEARLPHDHDQSVLNKCIKIKTEFGLLRFDEANFCHTTGRQAVECPCLTRWNKQAEQICAAALTFRRDGKLHKGFEDSLFKEAKRLIFMSSSEAKRSDESEDRALIYMHRESYRIFTSFII